MFIEQLARHPDLYITTVVLVVFSVCVHEASHTWTAKLCGDRTAWDGGYMTMNPLKLMGIPSLVMLFVVGIAWGQVPVNPARLRPQWRRGLVSFAGPAANIGLALAFAGMLACYSLVCDFVPDARSASSGVSQFLQVGLKLNVMLAIFNLLPVPPLDGWDVFATIIPGLSRVNQEIRNGAMVLLFMLFFFGGAGKYLWIPAYLATAVVCSLLGLEPYWRFYQG